MQLEVAAGDGGEVEDRVEEGDAGTWRAPGNEECDRERVKG